MHGAQFLTVVLRVLWNNGKLFTLYVCVVVALGVAFDEAGLWVAIVASQCAALINAIYLLTVVLDLGEASSTGKFSSAFIDSSDLFAAARHASNIFALDYLAHCASVILLLAVRITHFVMGKKESNEFAVPPVVSALVDFWVFAKWIFETLGHHVFANCWAKSVSFATLVANFCVRQRRRKFSATGRPISRQPTETETFRTDKSMRGHGVDPHTMWRDLPHFRQVTWMLVGHHAFLLLAFLIQAA